jgi:ribosomal-protein-alanine N-acetyltransferase
MPLYDLTGQRIGIRRPAEGDCDEFLEMVNASRSLHHPWVQPPSTAQFFEDYIRRRRTPGEDGFLICDNKSGRIAGVININCIVRGHFDSAYLGYYAAASFARQGYMTEGLLLVAKFAFVEMGLHRLEANIQPENVASIALVRRCGFRKEGFSPRYLKVLGEWQDHERWALRAK